MLYTVGVDDTIHNGIGAVDARRRVNAVDLRSGGRGRTRVWFEIDGLGAQPETGEMRIARYGVHKVRELPVCQ